MMLLSELSNLNIWQQSRFSLCVYEYGHADPNLVDYIYLVRKKKKSVAFLMFAAPVHR